MSEMNDQERDLDAAERALGTMPPSPETVAERQARAEWEDRLAPLASASGTVAPPDGLFARIAAQIAEEDGAAEIARLRGRVTRWKNIAALAATVAAAAIVWILQGALFPAPAPRYVAVVTSDADGSAGMIIQFDPGSGIASVVPVGATAPAGQSLEMWHLPVGAERPRSLGLMPEGAELRGNLTAGPGDIFAISFEPQGGSPTGQPTDPRFHGRIIAID